MHNVAFEEVIKNQINLSQKVLIEKAKEYATVDRLHNFRVAAQMQNCTMEQALGGFMCKHTVSIYDMIQATSNYGIERNQHTMEQWEEKITDHVNYLLILKAILEERRANKTIMSGIENNELKATLNGVYGEKRCTIIDDEEIKREKSGLEQLTMDINKTIREAIREKRD